MVTNEGDQTEVQYIHQFSKVSLIGGIAYSDSEVMGETVINFLPFPQPLEATTEQSRAYLYANANLTSTLLLTLGASYFDYEEIADQINTFEEDTVSPKLGIQWGVTPDVTLRFAALETVKPALTSNRTIEPTQIAGFNQFYDDINATKSQLLGAGIDWHLSNNLRLSFLVLFPLSFLVSFLVSFEGANRSNSPTISEPQRTSFPSR